LIEIPAILNNFHDLPQSLQANANLVPQLRDNHFFPDRLKLYGLDAGGVIK
jgi:hypothetical protein